MSIIVVGVGKKVFKEKKTMSEIAGKNGKVLLYPDFDDLSGHLDDILEATCGELRKIFSIYVENNSYLKHHWVLKHKLAPLHLRGR